MTDQQIYELLTLPVINKSAIACEIWKNEIQEDTLTPQGARARLKYREIQKVPFSDQERERVKRLIEDIFIHLTAAQV